MNRKIPCYRYPEIIPTLSLYERLEEGKETITQLELFTINKGVVSNLKFLWKKY